MKFKVNFSFLSLLCCQFGCCEALALLSSHYLTTLYPRAWNIFLSSNAVGQKPHIKRSTR